MIRHTEISNFLDCDVQILLSNQWISKGRLIDIKTSVLVVHDRVLHTPLIISLDHIVTISLWDGGGYSNAEDESSLG